MPKYFDDKELMERIDGDVAFLAETVQMLDTDGRDLLRQIGQAVAAGDAPAVGRQAHTLKGMVSNFCAPETQASAFELERLGKAGDLAGAPAALARLTAQLEELLAELAAFVQEKP